MANTEREDECIKMNARSTTTYWSTERQSMKMNASAAIMNMNASTASMKMNASAAIHLSVDEYVLDLA
jgi:hypothetical protein